MAAGSTYTPIATYTLSSAVSTYTLSSIPTTYTDIICVINELETIDGVNLAMQVGNGSVDTGTNYSYTALRGNGSSASSGRESNIDHITVDGGAGYMNTTWGQFIIQFQNYANTSTYKSVLCRAANASNGTSAVVGLWRSTSAINTIKFLTSGGGNFAVGTTFTLYGIAAA